MLGDIISTSMDISDIYDYLEYIYIYVILTQLNRNIIMLVKHQLFWYCSHIYQYNNNCCNHSFVYIVYEIYNIWHFSENCV